MDPSFDFDFSDFIPDLRFWDDGEADELKSTGSAERPSADDLSADKQTFIDQGLKNIVRMMGAPEEAAEGVAQSYMNIEEGTKGLMDLGGPLPGLEDAALAAMPKRGKYSPPNINVNVVNELGNLGQAVPPAQTGGMLNTMGKVGKGALGLGVTGIGIGAGVPIGTAIAQNVFDVPILEEGEPVPLEERLKASQDSRMDLIKGPADRPPGEFDVQSLGPMEQLDVLQFEEPGEQQVSPEQLRLQQLEQAVGQKINQLVSSEGRGTGFDEALAKLTQAQQRIEEMKGQGTGGGVKGPGGMSFLAAIIPLIAGIIMGKPDAGAQGMAVALKGISADQAKAEQENKAAALRNAARDDKLTLQSIALDKEIAKLQERNEPGEMEVDRLSDALKLQKQLSGVMESGGGLEDSLITDAAVEEFLGQGPKKDKLSEAQGKAVTFYNQARFGDEIMKKIEDEGVLDPRSLKFAVDQFDAADVFQVLNGVVSFKNPNFSKDPALQKYLQATGEFVEAAVRDPSGAAIKDEEEAMARFRNAIAIGDHPETIAQKQEARTMRMVGLRTKAGEQAIDMLNDADILEKHRLNEKVTSTGGRVANGRAVMYMPVDIVLDNGIRLRKGQKVGVTSVRDLAKMWILIERAQSGQGED